MARSSGRYDPKPAGRPFVAGNAPGGGGESGVEIGRRRAASPPGTGGAPPQRQAPDEDGGRIERLCVERGLKMTGQRRLIARVLSEAHDHPDVEEVYRRALALDSKVSIATVYRTVRLFEERGILERHDFGGARARYEPTEHDNQHHHHLIEVDTGQVVEFGSEEFERLARSIAAGLGFDLVSHRLELYGRRVPARSDSEGGGPERRAAGGASPKGRSEAPRAPRAHRGHGSG